MGSGEKVLYLYKGEMRVGYVKFMETSKKGVAKFGFVGTNHLTIALAAKPGRGITITKKQV
ncbi:MAG: hypothetical protein LBM75_05760, partial [Myxococcales bacterium]|jgi:hypothetical protein|nr:hypothetical protein [Myxococcales bacterium]